MSGLSGVLGVVLAAGSGRRFGGGKQLAPLAGRPLIAWALEAALDAGLERVLVVLGHRAGEVAAALPDDPRLERALNPDHAMGMGGSMALGARWAQERGARALVVLLGDAPLMRAETVRQVALAALESPAGAAAAQAGGRRCHPVAFAARHLAELTGVSGDSGGRELLERLGDGVALVAAPPESGLDVDQPADLARAARHLAPGGAPLRPGLAGLGRALGLEAPGLWSIAGSGGKTSLLYALAAELAAEGQPVVVTTSTHILPPSAGQAQGPWLLGRDPPDLGELAHRLEGGRPLCLAAGREVTGKLKGLDPEQLAALLERPGLWVLVEADGAAGRPLKGWAEHEPALCGLEAGLIVVAGASGLGRPLEGRWVHRPERLARAAGLEPGGAVSAEGLARALAGPLGPLRGLRPGARRSLLINQAEALAPTARRGLRAALMNAGAYERVLLASLRLGWFAPRGGQPR